MARIIPADYQTQDTASLHESERQTLEYLEEALPDSYTVFSSVLWARSHAHNTRFGELDFCVVSPAGHLVVIEQKSGGLTVREGHIYKRYGLTEKNAGAQILRSIAALKEVWQRQHQGQTIPIDYLLYLPDYQLREVTGLQFDTSRIVHAGSTSLAATLESLCSDTALNPVQVSAIHDFLTGVLELELDIGRLQSHQERFYLRHESSLIAWVKRLQFSPYVLRVNGGAGSGKTQLGMSFFRETCNRGEKVRYICFNRPLADGVAQAVGDTEHIQSRDHFYSRFLHEHGIHPDYTRADAQFFEKVEAQVAALPVPESWQSDLLIIDEGQDIPPRSLEVLRRFLRPGGRLVWLEDPEQNLYGNAPVDLENAVELRLDECFRSPAAIVKVLNLLFPDSRPLVPVNPIQGQEPAFHITDKKELPVLLTKRITQLCEQGIYPKDIAIISLHGLQRSALNDTERLGNYQLTRFTGEYNAEGKQQWTEGDIVLDSIYRFKGNQRPFIFLIDADFTKIDEKTRRLFYCGMTRATLGLEIFLTPECEKALQESLTSRQ